MIIDSTLSVAEAIRDNPSFPCPPEILAAQRCITVRYRSFDERAHQGQIVVHEHIATDIAEIFGELYRMHFPIGHVVPIADSPIVSLFTSRGFIWGGHWENRRDYQHFEKHLSEVVIKK